MPEPDYRQFLIDTFKKRHEVFLRNYAGVISNPDSEPVHDFRVSIRRLAAILSLLAKLGRYGADTGIKKDLKKMMAPLGELRDIQVRIEWIKHFSPDPSAVHLKIIETLKKMETSIIERIATNLENVSLKRIKGMDIGEWIEPPDKMVKDIPIPLPELCRKEMLSLLDRFLKLMIGFKKTGKMAGLHRARIALKKFRYTFEIFSPFYPDLANEFLQDIQTGLGDIHDMDLLGEWLLEIKNTFPVADQRDLEQLYGKLETDRKRRLKKVKKNLARDINVLRGWRRQMKDKRSAENKSALKNSRAEVVSLCERFDPDPPHAAHVTKLAMQLFNELGKLGLHELGERHKILLEYGCLLHDIGWVDGQQKHHKKSFKMICESDLPLNRKDKLAVALIARFHRKGDPDKQEEYMELPKKDREAVAKLAAMIRIADVFDRMHNQNVKIEEVALKDNTIFITITASSIANISENAIAKKSAYFQTAFGLPAVITEKGSPTKKADPDTRKSG